MAHGTSNVKRNQRCTAGLPRIADSLPHLFVGSWRCEAKPLSSRFLFCSFLCFVLYDGLGGGYG